MPAPLRQRLPARPEQLAVMRRAVRRWAASAALSVDASDDLLLALGEAAANAVEHAYRDGAEGDWCYEVARCGDGSTAVVVQDRGTWRPPPADPGHRGRGVALVRQLAEDVVLDHAGPGTTVRFRLPGTRRPGGGDGAARAPVEGTAEPAHLGASDGPDGMVLGVRGELDLASVDAVRADLLAQLAALPAGARVTLDLGATTYLPSAGIGLLLEATEQARARGVELCLAADPAGLAARVLALAGLPAG
jgi:anti-anti-sigma factor